MNQAVKRLIPAIASYVKDKESNLSKTKLLKLLYLFDVEYYRLHRETFTQFQWKFFHLGPWTSELDPLLEELITTEALIPRVYSTPEYEGKNYEAVEDCDIGPLFESINDEMALKGVLSDWADRPLGEILDYIYFRTEPMEHGIRNAPLNFDLIPTQPPERYKRSASGKSAQEIAKLRKAFQKKLIALNTQQSFPFEFTPPRYDEEFYQNLSKLDEATT